MKEKKQQMVTIRMDFDQKEQLINDAAANGASINQYILLKLGLIEQINEVNAKRGKRAVSKKVKR